MSSAGLRKVVVVGQGYVGLPLAMRAVQARLRRGRLRRRRVPSQALGRRAVLREDVTAEELQAALDSGRYRPSSETRSCQGFDVAVITVPTPLREGNPDLSYIEEAARTP